MGNFLTLSETMLLLAIMQLGDEAYGVAIREAVSSMSGKAYTYGSLYSALDQLVRKEYVLKEAGEPTPERGGRRKIFYSLTPKGTDALRTAWELHNALWGDLGEEFFTKRDT